MDIHLLHTLSGIAILLSLLCKVLVHFYLDYLHQRNLSLGSLLIMPLVYLLPYKSKVDIRYAALKITCNFFLVFSGVALILNVIIGILLIN
jgi:hypothetical protein